MSSDVGGLPKYQHNVPAPLASDQVHTQEDLHTQAYQIENDLKPEKRWNEKAHDFFDKLDEQLEESLPNNSVQKVLDDFYDKSIEPVLQKGRELNRWIDKNDYGSWYKDLAAFVIKLPIRAVRNILKLAFNLIRGTVYTFVHPLKALTKLGHYFIQFIEALLIPATYTKVGAGILGASAGQAIFSFGIPTIVGLSVGGSLIAIGLMAGAIKSGIEAEEGKKGEAIKAELWNQIKAIPECALTGFLMGIMFGGIQKAVNAQTTVYQPPSGIGEAQKFVDQFLKSHGVNIDPSSYTVHYSPETGVISAEFAGPQLQHSLVELSHHGLAGGHGNVLAVSSMAEKYTLAFQNPNMIAIPGLKANAIATLELDTGQIYTGYNDPAVALRDSIIYPTGDAIPQGAFLPASSFVASCEVVQN